MIAIHSKIGQGKRSHFEKLVNRYGKNELIPVYLENNILISTEPRIEFNTNNVNDAEHCLAKN